MLFFFLRSMSDCEFLFFTADEKNQGPFCELGSVGDSTQTMEPEICVARPKISDFFYTFKAFHLRTQLRIVINISANV